MAGSSPPYHRPSNAHLVKACLRNILPIVDEGAGALAHDVGQMKTSHVTQLLMTTYPGFHSLPKGVKSMLLVSESLFFEQAQTKPDVHIQADLITPPLSVWKTPEPASVMARAA